MIVQVQSVRKIGQKTDFRSYIPSGGTDPKSGHLGQQATTLSCASKRHVIFRHFLHWSRKNIKKPVNRLKTGFKPKNRFFLDFIVQRCTTPHSTRNSRLLLRSRRFFTGNVKKTVKSAKNRFFPKLHRTVLYDPSFDAESSIYIS